MVGLDPLGSMYMKRLADVEAWEAYCEASLDLSNQDDVGKDTPWLDCADGFEDLPDEDADLIDSGSRVGQFESVSLSATNNSKHRGRRRIWIGI
jgi:hypothetical protein